MNWEKVIHAGSRVEGRTVHIVEHLLMAILTGKVRRHYTYLKIRLYLSEKKLNIPLFMDAINIVLLYFLMIATQK